ncbi:hypothetical protein [Shewanella sp. UCD-KL12]|uniref:hypothetical protein n=1 Tax=Shewanella sp. UCD-KL12 TaxID=1917163 RepID=UPI0009707F59|nr:hypothetical protein [Shewanella sp. UCD-KL12]
MNQSRQNNNKKHGLLGPLLLLVFVLLLIGFLLSYVLPHYLLKINVPSDNHSDAFIDNSLTFNDKNSHRPSSTPASSQAHRLLTHEMRHTAASQDVVIEPQAHSKRSVKLSVSETRPVTTNKKQIIHPISSVSDNAVLSHVQDPGTFYEKRTFNDKKAMSDQSAVNDKSIVNDKSAMQASRVIQGEVVIKQVATNIVSSNHQLDEKGEPVTVNWEQASQRNTESTLDKGRVVTSLRCDKQVLVSYTSDHASEELFIISQLKYGSMIMSDELFAYQQDGKQYLPIQLLAELLLLPIQLDSETQSVSGWFIDKEKRINISDGLMAFWGNGASCSSQMSKLFYDDWDLYLDAEIIESMFGLSISFEPARQQFFIDESAAIPLTQLMARKKRYELFTALQKQQGSIQVSEIDREDAMLGDLAMSMDLGVTSQDKAAHKATRLDGFVQARADVAGHNTYAGYSWSSTGETVNAYIEKTLADSWVSHYRLGSIESHSIPLISESTEGVGVRISAGDSFTEDFRSITVEGEVEPGWDVELYRNNTLVSVQRAGQDAKYRFIDVPFYIGVNQYQLRFFGLNGETRTETFSKVLDQSVMEQGALGFSYGAMVSDADELQQHYLNANWAVSDGLTAGVSLVQQETIEGQWLTIPKVSVNLLAGQNLVQMNYAAGDGGFATGLTIQGSSGEINWLADWELYDDFASWENNNNSVHQQAQVNLNGSLALLPLSWTLSGSWKDYDIAADHLQLSGIISGQVNKLAFSNEVRWQQTPQQNTINNRVAASGRLNEWYLRTYLDFSVTPDLAINQWVVNANSTLTKRFNYQVELNYQPQTDDPFSIRNSLSYLFDHSSLRLVIDNYSSGDWFTQLKWNSSLLWHPETNLWLLDRVSHLNTGAVKILAFQDDNANGIFDDEEQGISGLSFSGHSNSGDVTDDNGELLITHLQTTRAQRLILKEASLPDPFLIPLMTAINVNPHPGNIQEILYPILYTAELEGVVLERVAGGSLPAKGIQVVFMDKSNHREYKAIVEFDGVFIIDRMLPGHYEMSIGDKIISTIELLPGEYRELKPIVLQAEVE